MSRRFLLAWIVAESLQAASLPMFFEPEHGNYFASLHGQFVEVSPARVRIGSGNGRKRAALEWVGASQGVLAGEDPTGGVTHYFIGSKAAEWQTGVSHYSRVQVRGLYPGIDLTYYFREERLEFDLTIRPGSDPEMLHF